MITHTTIEPSGFGEGLYNLEVTGDQGQLKKYVLGADRSDVLRELKDKDPKVVDLLLIEADKKRK